jgi:hypothetical protein
MPSVEVNNFHCTNGVSFRRGHGVSQWGEAVIRSAARAARSARSATIRAFGDDLGLGSGFLVLDRDDNLERGSRDGVAR